MLNYVDGPGNCTYVNPPGMYNLHSELIERDTTMAPQTPALHPRRGLRIPGLAYGALVLTIFFGTLIIAQQLGFWSVSGKLTADGAPVELSGADPAEVKGWMTIQAVLDAYHVDQGALYEQFGIPADIPPTTALKDLEEVAPEFSVTDLRTWLTEQANQ